MKRIITMSALAAAMLLGGALVCAETSASAMTSISARPKAETRTVTFKTTIHCKNCANKVRENLSFEKGVKDLEISVEDKTVKVTYEVGKTSVEALAAAIRKLGYEAKVVE